MELICYVYEGWDPRIRPASPRRDWMDQSPESFAYRCLPLSIGNAHGWEILSPCGFSARWDGSQGVEGVEIVLDADTEPGRGALSMFGMGTFTFHIEGIFRTEPGWNLFVSGPPNFAKDGVAPLGAVIETDWSPYSFTMNWRITRPDHWIRFERDEPICFLFPVQRGLVASVEPRIVPIEQAPDLLRDNREWGQSRDAFQSWVNETQPEAPADKWQKLYYRGMCPGNRPGPADHESKLRVRPFAGIEALEAKRQKGCPREGTARNPANPAVPAGPDAAALRRRDWILSTMEAQRRLAADADEIPRVSGLSSAEFLERFYAPSRPVIITGELADWPALGRWTPDYLKILIGGAEIEYQGGRQARETFELYKDDHKSRMAFDAYIDMIETQPGNNAYLTAYNSGTNSEALAPLRRDIRPLAKFLRGEPGMAWIGPIGTFTPLHFDLTNNLLAQVTGTKRLILLPPSESRYLYNDIHVFSPVHDIMDDEALARYPLAAQARTYEVDLAAGELLYIPIGWWHQVTSLDFSVTFTHTDFLWKNEFHEQFS